MTLARRTGQVVAFLGLLFVLVATLTPLPKNAADAARTSFWCLVCGSTGAVDVSLNVILFIPFGLGLRLAGLPWRRVVAASALLTIFVETMQYSLIAGRDASLSDLLTNMAGGTIGATLGSHLRWFTLPRAEAARRLIVAWATGWLAMLALTAWLIQPQIPAGPFRMIWRQDLPKYAPYTGRVLSAAVNGVAVDPGMIPDSLALRQRLLDRDLELSFDAIVGQVFPFWAPTVTLLSPEGLVDAVFEKHDDLIFELPTYLRRWRLRTVALRLDGGRPAMDGELIRVTAGERDGTFWITSLYGGERRHTELALSPSFGWSILLPFDYAYGPEVHFLTGLWIAGLLFPLGYWARWTRPGRSRQGPPVVLGIALVVVVGLALIPWLTGYPPVHPSEWLAAAIGVAAGWAVAGRVTYLARECASPSASESYSS